MKELISKISTQFRNLHAGLSFPLLLNERLLEHLGTTFGKSKLEKLGEDANSLQVLALENTLNLPPIYYDFINAYLEKKVEARAFDPWFGFSSPLINLTFKEKIALCPFEPSVELLSKHFAECNIMPVAGYIFENAAMDLGMFDIIISNPIFFEKSKKIETSDSWSSYFIPNLISYCHRYLAESGQMIFTVPSSFLRDAAGKASLKKNDIHVKGVFTLPTNSLQPTTASDAHIIVLEKVKEDKTFIAPLHESTLESIISNFKNHKDSKQYETGTFISFENFKSVRTWKAEKESQRLGLSQGFNGMKLCEISSIENIDIRMENFDNMEISSSDVFVPKNSLKPVFSNPNSSDYKPKNFFRLIVDDSIVSKSYLIQYLNSPLGVRQRESLLEGDVIPRTSMRSLMNMTVFLPDRTTQDLIMSIDIKIEQLNLQLGLLKNELWRKPKQMKDIENSLLQLNSPEKLENWIDCLPFPLSSILWRYYATTDTKQKVEHLLNFFEALAEFISVTMLSALTKNEEIYNNEKHNWLETQERYKNWYLAASFGSWNIFNTKMAKVVRTHYSNPNSKGNYTEIFGNPSEYFMQMLTSKELGNLLNEAAQLRNKWKGHSGLQSPQEHDRQAITLEELLNRIRRQIGRAFEEYSIISPISSEYQKGLFSYKVKTLIGARTPFSESIVKSIIPLERGKLYSLHIGSMKPIELVQFIKYDEEHDAVYFYSRVESRHVRWVSYHFEKKSELVLPQDEEINRLFEFLKSE